MGLWQQLTRIVGGEIPKGINLVVMGLPGVGKTVFCENLLHEYLNRGSRAVYITLTKSPQAIREWLAPNNPDSPGGPSLIRIIDGYSWLLGESPEPICVRNLSNLSDLSVKIVSTMTEVGEEAFCMIDSISNLLTYNSENETMRFLEVNMARMRKNQNIALYTIEEGIHTDGFYRMLRHLSDGVIEIGRHPNAERKRRLKVDKFLNRPHSSDWYTFRIRNERQVEIALPPRTMRNTDRVKRVADNEFGLTLV